MTRQSFKLLGSTEIVLTDAFAWLETARRRSIHAVVTDPPYGLLEYTERQLEKMRIGRGGIWRISSSFDGCRRSPLPLGKGVILDPFMGSGYTIATACACGPRTIGLEISSGYFQMAQKAIPALAQYTPRGENGNGIENDNGTMVDLRARRVSPAESGPDAYPQVGAWGKAGQR